MIAAGNPQKVFISSGRLAKLAGQRGTANPARDGESRQGRRVPGGRLGSMTQIPDPNMNSETMDVEEPDRYPSQTQPFACICACS